MFEIELPFGFGSEEEFILEMQKILPHYEIATFEDALEVYGRIRVGII
jgi:hypothetical protein